MAKTQNLFTNIRSDSDTNYALLDNKSHVYVENLRISGDGDDGSFKSLKGSKLVSSQYGGENGVVIREFEGQNNKLYYCVAHKNKLSSIVEYDTETEVSRLIIQDSAVLRFDMIRWDDQGNLKDSPYEYLLSFNQIGDFLLFSSQYWQYPRMVNLTRVADYAAGFTEEDIVLIKKPPFYSPEIIDKILDPTIADKELRNKFISLSYRYKYVDGDFSSLSSYSDTLFWQKSDHFSIDSKRKNLGMENANNKVKLRVDSGGKYVTNVEVYAREHGSNVSYLIYNLNKKLESVDDNANVDIDYSFSKKYEVLDKDSTNLLYSNCPLFPYAQESIGNRITYANFIEGFDLKDKDGNDVNVDYEVFNNQIEFDPDPEVQNRTAVSLFSYKVAAVFLNDYNISTTCLLPTKQMKSEVEITFEDRLKVNQLQVKFDQTFKAPAFATKLKFAVKTEKLNYEILYITYGKKVGKYTYLQLINDNVSRVKKGDVLILIDVTQTDYHEVIIEELAIFGPAQGLETTSLYMKIKDDDNVINLTPNGTTISKSYKEHQNGGVGEYEDYVWGIDFVYGSSDTRRFDATSGYAGENNDPALDSIWYYSSINNRGHLLKSDFGAIKEGDTIRINLNFEYMWKKAGGTYSTNGLGNINLSKEVYASKDYLTVFDFLKGEYDEPLITVTEDVDNVWFLTNYLYPNYVKDSGIPAYYWSPNEGAGSQASEALAVNPTTNITLIRGIEPITFRTKQITLDDDGNDENGIYYETDKIYKIENGVIVPDSFDGSKPVFDINFYNGYNWEKGIESYKIRDEFNGKSLNNNFRPNAYDIKGYKALRKENDATYGGLYNYELKLNQLSVFNPSLLNWKTLPAKYGPIKRVLSSDNNITVYCVNKVMLVMYEKSVLMDLTGSESVATSNEVLGGVVVIDYECGVGNNPESVVSVGNAHIFADPIRKRLYIKQGRDIQELNAKGTGCFNEFVKLLSNHKTFLGCFDDARGEYVLGIDQDFSVAYSVAAKGIVGYFKNKFDYLHSMDGKSFTAWKGKIYQNEVTDNPNDFAGQGVFAAKIKAVVNPQMDADKVFKAWYLQSNTGWNTEIRTNLTSTVIPESAYVQKESFFHTEIFRDIDSPLGIKGIGVIDSKVGKQLIFKNSIENTVAINDTLNVHEGFNSSKIIGIENNMITVEDATAFSEGEYVFASKVEENGYRPDGIPMRGQWMEFTLTKVPERDIFLTSVYTEVIESKL